MEITLVGLADMGGIRALLRANRIDTIREEDKADGFVTTSITDEQRERLILRKRGVTVAREGDRVLAFAFAASWDYWSTWTFFRHMMEELPKFSFQGQTLTTENTYQYGPVCLDRAVRGTGVFEQVFAFSLASMKDRSPIMTTFINQINGRSYAAHTRKVHMEQVGTFSHGHNHYYLMACPTTPDQEGR